VSGPGQGASPSGGLWLLLALRFLLELALLAAVVVGVVRLVDGAAGWIIGILAALLVAAIWGIFLSPRRRVQSPVGVRVTAELVLFLVAAALLAASGLVPLAVALVVAEVVVLGLLRGPDRHAL
jgi:hypothetical protein